MVGTGIKARLLLVQPTAKVITPRIANPVTSPAARNTQSGPDRRRSVRMIVGAAKGAATNPPPIVSAIMVYNIVLAGSELTRSAKHTKEAAPARAAAA